MTENKKCTVLCGPKTIDKELSKRMAERIHKGYNVHLWVPRGQLPFQSNHCCSLGFALNLLVSLTDNLPAATKFELLETNEFQYEHGYKLGFVRDEKVRFWILLRYCVMTVLNLILLLLKPYLHNHLKFILFYHIREGWVLFLYHGKFLYL